LASQIIYVKISFFPINNSSIFAIQKATSGDKAACGSPPMSFRVGEDPAG
jgi:hypothetical protein